MQGEHTTTSKSSNIIQYYRTKSISYEELDTENFRSTEDVIYDILWDGVHFEFFIHYKPDSAYAVIFGNGGLNRTKKNTTPMPFFHRISWASRIPGTAIYYFDPTLYLGDLLAGYGYGTNDRWYLKQIAVLIDRILNKLNIPLTNTLFYGSSVGGFTSICLAAMLHSRATVINPRLNAEKTASRVVESLKENCLKEGETLLSERTNVMSVFQNEGYFPLLHIIQNIDDKFNMKTQIIPFLDQMSIEPMDCTGRLHFEFYFLEGGHNAGPPADVCLQQIADDMPLADIFYACQRWQQKGEEGK